MTEALRIPLLVSHRKGAGYRLRCLFLPEIEATAERYETALNKLRQAIAQYFKGVRCDRSTLDERLWLSFGAPLRFELVPLGFDAGRRWVDGLFAAAHFSVGERRYACLPQLDGTVADLGDGSVSAAGRTERLVACIQRFFRERRKEQGEEFDPQRYLSAAHDELGEIELSLHLAPGTFPFEPSADRMASLRGDDIGDGPAEMARVAADLNELYPDELGRAVLRDELVSDLARMLYRADAGAIVLVGPRGAGKTALIHGAVRQYIDSLPGRQRSRLQKLWHLDPMRVISGMSVIGQWQRRMAVVLAFLQSRLRTVHAIDKPDHLFCDNLVALLTMGKSSQNSLTLADVLRPHLERRAFTLVGEATPEAWQKVQQRDRRFADLFRVVRVDPPARGDAIRIVGWRRAELEQRHGCRIESSAVAELLKLERRFANDEVLPGSALRVLDRLAVRHAKRTIGRAEVMAAYLTDFHFREQIFSRHVGLPLAETAHHFATRLVGQRQASASLVDVVALIKSGMAAPGRPLSSMLFIGPTGVGKSEAAKLLADYLFADAGGLIRFDMNEYVDPDAPDRLIGDATRPDGQLTAAVRQRRAGVLLLDEIEKAHPVVHDLLLQLLGEGRLTDALGRTTDFSQCVVILTSNLGATAAERRTGFAHQPRDAVHTYREAVERFFRPELLNRIDQVVSFKPLAREDMAGIARLQLDRILARDGFVRRMTFLNVSAEALDHFADIGLDEALGARALKRGIERALTGPIAQRLASSQPSDPMLLDVGWAAGDLVTQATTLQYATARDVPLPMDDGSLSGCERLLEQANALASAWAAALDQAPPAETVLALRALQVRLDPLREELERRAWDLAERRAVPGARLTVVPPRSREWRWYGRPLNDMLEAKLDIHEFFDRLHAESLPARGADSVWVRWQIELNLLARRSSQLSRKGVERVDVDIAPLQSGDGQALVSTAWEDYAALLTELDVHELPSPQAGVRRFEGVGLSEAWAGECGVHFWYRGDDRPVPIRIRQRAAGGAEWVGPPSEVIRIRYEPTRDADLRRLTDLRSGHVRRFAGPLSADDWRLLLWLARPATGPAEGH
ncbi:AAA family ATPase [Ideonella sp. DXS29W]|uniref:AAA family ATPase n=1 Tax=Ideonella lacteola TaxID=2984193 RepID=A0ABU9BKN3_9BURK